MEYLGLGAALGSNILLAITDKKTSSKLTTSNNILYFSYSKTFLCAVFALLLHIFNPLQIDLNGIIIALFAGLFHAASVILIMHCLKAIPAVNVNLFMAAGVIIPSLFAWIFLNQTVTLLKFASLFLLIISLIFTLNVRKIELSKIKISLLMFFCYGLLMLMQGIFPKFSENSSKLTFSLIMYSFSAILLRIIFSLKKGTKTSFDKTLGGLCVIAAIFNLTINVLLTSLSSTLSTAIVFPAVHGLKLVLITLLSPVLWKEKLSATQLIGSFFAIAFITILSI